MRIVRTAAEMRMACRGSKAGGRTLGLVPTMGALHAGHMSLVDRARHECKAVAASIFVNPTQFAAGEDFESYPRTFEEDCEKLQAAGVELLFAPTAEEMYPAGATTVVEVQGIGDRLDGASRPGHFRGVATVVAKLFNIACPDRAYFGQKDAAQVAVLRAMVRDLNFGVELVTCATVREHDGLAMSSRNRRLSAEERGRAVVLSRALGAVESSGATDAEELRLLMLDVLAEEPELRLDYAEVVDAETLLPVADVRGGALVAVAGWLGDVRLIDNVMLKAVQS